jgi:hypothetical protein
LRKYQELKKKMAAHEKDALEAIEKQKVQIKK